MLYKFTLQQNHFLLNTNNRPSVFFIDLYVIWISSITAKLIRPIILCGIIPVHTGLNCPMVENRLFPFRYFFAVFSKNVHVVSKIIFSLGYHDLSPVAKWELLGQFINSCLRCTHFFLSLRKENMTCGCKKGSGVTLHGGSFKRKKRRRKKGSGYSPLGAAVRAGVGAYRAMTPRRPLRRVARRVMGALGRKRGSGRANFLPGVTWHKGSGMGFSGAGMSFNGSGLRGKRMAVRQGTGRRMI
jgi:hypothetical protein